MPKLFDLMKVNIATPGTGDITFGTTFSTAFLSPSEAGAIDGDTVRYVLIDGADVEIGIGLIKTSVSVMGRTVIKSKISGIVGTSEISLSGTAILAFTASADDILNRYLNLADVDSKSGARDNILALEKTSGNAALVAEQSAPSTPSAGKFAIYADANGLVRSKNDNGADRGYGTVISLNTITSGDTTVDIALPAEFGSFLILVEDIAVNTSGAQLSIRVSTDGGSTYASGASDYSYNLRIIGSTVSAFQQSSSSFTICSPIDTSNAAIAVAGTIRVFPGGGGATSQYQTRFGGPDSGASGAYAVRELDGYRSTSTRVTNLRIALSGGTLVRGKARLHLELSGSLARRP